MIRPNSQGHEDPDCQTGQFREGEAEIVDTFPQYTVDGIELPDAQSREYAQLLDDCDGDTGLADDVWAMAYLKSGDAWLPMENFQHFETDPNFMGAVEGTEADQFDDRKN